MATTPVSTPILFVTQVPVDPAKFPNRLGTFANHITTVDSLPRGGDLMLRYPDGTLRNLTREAGFGMDGFQGAQAIAVREPAVSWDGTKAVFSMLIGAAPKRYQHPNAVWQLYEASGLAKGQTATIAKVPGQPSGFNNVSPIYGSDDAILFTSDRPRGGEPHLYPQLDEYESTPTIAGMYRLEPGTGALRLLNHVVSGAFSPSIDSFGRVIFVRWDHLQRDQQVGASFGPYNVASELPGAANIGLQPESFPEAREGMPTVAHGQVAGFTTNLFQPWQMRQDGTDELTINHLGRHEMAYPGYLPRSFVGDPALSDTVNVSLFANRKNIREDGGIFHVREDPVEAGTYYGIYSREFGTSTTAQIVRFAAAPHVGADQIRFVDASAPESSNALPGGRFRNPLPLTTGHFVAAHTSTPTATTSMQLRLRQLTTDGAGLLVAGAPLTGGIVKSLTWWSPDVERTFNGALWELDPVEVVARPRPPMTREPTLDGPERQVLAEEDVSEAELRDWLRATRQALIVTRNQTARDRTDRQQPYNLRVPNGTATVANAGKVYEIAHYQIFQANSVRAYSNHSAGRRPLAQPVAAIGNVTDPTGPPGSVPIAPDGSTAAFVPAHRALTWQTTDAHGEAIVRERMWVTMQPGEIRVCGGCHGANSADQAGRPAPTNKPEALRTLLRAWKQSTIEPIAVNGSAPLIPPADVQVTQAPVAVRYKPAAVSTPREPLRARRGGVAPNRHPR